MKKTAKICRHGWLEDLKAALLTAALTLASFDD